MLYEEKKELKSNNRIVNDKLNMINFIWIKLN